MTGYVAVVDPTLEDNPSCHVCGAIMVPVTKFGGIAVTKYWICSSCGATTLPTEEGKK